MRQRKKLHYGWAVCAGCALLLFCTSGLCVNACPKQIIEIKKDIINKKGHSPAGITDQSKCIACAFCATMCPDCIITVEKG